MGKKRVAVKTTGDQMKAPSTINVKEDRRGGVREGRVYISSSYNNTLLTLTNEQGDTLYWTSAGNIGFRGTKKGTPFAASKAAEALTLAMQKLKIGRVAVFVKGIGSGREAAIRSLVARSVDISSIRDVTPIPHNGCRPPKPRRV